MLTGKQRAGLRAQANGLEPLFQVGKGGISEALLTQVDDALKARELIKIKVLLESCPMTPRETADAIAAKTGADVVQVIGGCLIFYRESPELQQKLAQKAANKKAIAKKNKLKAIQQARENRRYPFKFKGGNRT